MKPERTEPLVPEFRAGAHLVDTVAGRRGSGLGKDTAAAAAESRTDAASAVAVASAADVAVASAAAEDRKAEVGMTAGSWKGRV